MYKKCSFPRFYKALSGLIGLYIGLYRSIWLAMALYGFGRLVVLWLCVVYIALQLLCGDSFLIYGLTFSS